MSLIDRAAQALLSAGSGATTWDSLDSAGKNHLRDAVRTVLKALREPDERMLESGAEIIRNVGPSEPQEAYQSDAANAWRYMIDALLGERA